MHTHAFHDLRRALAHFRRYSPPTDPAEVAEHEARIAAYEARHAAGLQLFAADAIPDEPPDDEDGATPPGISPVEVLLPDEPEEDELLTARQVARRLSCSVRTVWRMTDSGELPRPRRFNREFVRFSCNALAAWIRENFVPVAPR